LKRGYFGVKITMKKTILSILLVMVLALTVVSADMELTIDSSSLSGDPTSGNEQLSFTLTLKNTGTDTIDAITLTSSTLTDTASNTITAPSVSDVTSLAGSDTTTDVSFTVTIPVTPSGSYAGTITASDDAGNISDATVDYTVVVDDVDVMTVSISEINEDFLPGDNEDKTFTITNDGTTTLSSISATFESDDGDSGKIEDNDGDEIVVTINAFDDELEPGDSVTVTVEFDVDDKIDVESDYDGVITIAATSSAATTVSDKEIQVSIDILPEICSDGILNDDLEISIKDPDNNDDFAPGETVEVQVKVSNDGKSDMDVVIEIILFDETDGDKVKTVKEEVTIDNDETDTITIELKLPSNLDDDHDYSIYAQVHEDGEEDEHCDYDKISIDIERNDEDAMITEVSLSDETLDCGDDYRLSVDVESTGSRDIDDLYVEVLDGDLELSESSKTFDLGDHNDKDNEESLYFDFTVPEDLAEGDYYIEVILYDDNGDQLDSELVLVEIGRCDEVTQVETTATSTNTLKLSVSKDYKVDEDELTIALEIENIDSESHQITVSVEEVSWAKLDDSEYLKSLNSGDKIHAYLYFTLDLETQDEHSLQVTVSDEDGNEVSEIITIDFGSKVTEVEEDPFFKSISDWFKEHSTSKKFFWILADLVLIILALVFVRMLFSKR
jgi:hypothetical protein